ncbi:MAG TPA: four helix bundle protein, partial [Gemmatimonadales bacterium]|nr:four helix bundle protein [Gemmatimonadales bacterium]
LPRESGASFRSRTPVSSMIRSYRDLIVWQKAMDLACAIPVIARQLPLCETRSLGEQMRRAVVSVPANIAEGYGRRSRAEFLRFLAIASASLRELETLLLLTERRGLAKVGSLTEAFGLVNEVGRMLTVLHRRLRG